MYFFKNKKNYAHNDIDSGDIVRLVLSEKFFPINFSMYSDFVVLDVRNNCIEIDINKCERSDLFSGDGLEDVGNFGDYIEGKINGLYLIPFEYVWMVDKKKKKT